MGGGGAGDVVVAPGGSGGWGGGWQRSVGGDGAGFDCGGDGFQFVEVGALFEEGDVGFVEVGVGFSRFLGVEDDVESVAECEAVFGAIGFWVGGEEGAEAKVLGLRSGCVLLHV